MGTKPSKQKSKLSDHQILLAQREAAMPEVKTLVKKFGRPAVSWCVNQLHELEKKMKQLEKAKAEVEKLETELRD